MQFVNVHGEVVDLAKLTTPKKVRTAAPKEATHKGFAVMGVSPEQINEARKDHEKRSAERQSRGEMPLQPFDVEAFARNAKCLRVSKKPFSTQAGAEECRALAERQGWVRVRVDPLAKV